MGFAAVDHETGEQGVTFVTFYIIIHFQAVTLTFTD